MPLFQIISGQKSILQYRILPGYEALLSLILLQPFSHNRSKWLKLLQGLCIIQAIISMSRAVWLLLILYGIFNFYHKKRQMLVVLLLLTAIIGVSLIVIPEIQILLNRRLISIFDDDAPSNVERIGLARTAINAGFNKPFFGVGALNFPIYMLAQPDKSFIHAKNPDDLAPHNFFLQTFAEHGLIGLLGVLLIFTSMYKIIQRTEIYIHNNSLYEFFAALKIFSLVILVILIFGFVANQFRLYLLLNFGIVLSILRLEKEIESQP